MAGAEIDVPAPDGERVRMKLRAGTGDGVHKLRGVRKLFVIPFHKKSSQRQLQAA